MNYKDSAIYQYAMGHNGQAGIACISGDAGGWERMEKSLSRQQVEDAIVAYLENDIDDALLLEDFERAEELSTMMKGAQWALSNEVSLIARDHQHAFFDYINDNDD